MKNLKDFAVKGNIVDLAVGVIIGGAFGSIINSIVQDVTMPLLNPLMPKGHWREWVVGPGIKLGNFLGTVINFVIVAIVMFGVVSLLHARRKKQEAKKAVGLDLDHTDQLLTDIREEMRGLRRELAEHQGPPPVPEE
ncbi:MAG: large conductance mechanosensitive channel protein MscL [Flavobacteriales bacterium]